MHIVVTNDDGVAAAGISALADAAVAFGEVTVIAPAEPHSSCGHAFSRAECIAVWRLDWDGAWYAVEGTPVDCMRVAIAGGLVDRPALVLSGINQGGNVGTDVYPSGTVAAAREAALLGVPAIAISQYLRSDAPADWAWAGARARELIEEILDGRYDDQVRVRAGLHWNVNLPVRADAADPPRRVVVPHDTAPLALRYERSQSDDGAMQFRNLARYRERESPDGGDAAALFSGAITVTPLGLSLNASGH